MRPVQWKHFWQASHTMTGMEVVGDSGGSGFGSGGEAHSGPVALLFDNPGGWLVDLFLSRSGEFDKINIYLPLSTIGFKRGLK